MLSDLYEKVAGARHCAYIRGNGGGKWQRCAVHCVGISGGRGDVLV